MVGAHEGVTEGSEVGLFEGPAVGNVVGLMDGCIVDGSKLGSSLRIEGMSWFFIEK